MVDGGIVDVWLLFGRGKFWVHGISMSRELGPPCGCAGGHAKRQGSIASALFDSAVSSEADVEAAGR